MADASSRLAEELGTADVIAAEDTRRLRRLTSELGVTVTGRVVSYFDGNEAARTPILVEALLAGERVLLVTDAGMPSVSDPGYRLVAAAVEAGIEVTAVPGPSAVLTALAVSGLPVDRFCFEGFLPRKAGERARRLGALTTSSGRWCSSRRRTAPRRRFRRWPRPGAAPGRRPCAGSSPRPTRRYAAARWRISHRGPADGVRGEVTIVVAGADASATVAGDTDSLRAAVAEHEADGMSRKDAIVEVARLAGVPKREVYQAVHVGD